MELVALVSSKEHRENSNHRGNSNHGKDYKLGEDKIQKEV